MLDEMEQVKRFLFDVKEAYEIDRQEWIIAKEEFRTQLEIKENLWLDCNMRLHQIIGAVRFIFKDSYHCIFTSQSFKIFKLRAVQSNDSIPNNLSEMFMKENSKENMMNGLGNDSNSSNEVNMLNNLVGGTSNLLDMKLASSHQHRGVNASPKPLHPFERIQYESQLNRPITPSKITTSNLQPIEEMNRKPIEDDLALIDTTKDRKELEIEFDQVKLIFLIYKLIFFFRLYFKIKMDFSFMFLYPQIRKVTLPGALNFSNNKKIICISGISVDTCPPSF